MFPQTLTGEVPRYDGDGRIAAAIRRAKVTEVKTVSIDDDPEFRECIAHVLKPDEKIGEFVARTGLGRGRALSMTAEEISSFVRLADERNADNPCLPPGMYETKVPVPKFLVV